LKISYLEECGSPSDFHNIYFSHYGSQWGPATVWLATFFKIYSSLISHKHLGAGAATLPIAGTSFQISSYETK